MTTSSDPDRLIQAFLDEGGTELPERVYDDVRFEIENTRQRVTIGPWRNATMNAYAKLAVAAAAVVVVAVVGLTVFGPSFGFGSPSPTPTASPSPTPAPTSVAVVGGDRQPPAGPLDAGSTWAIARGGGAIHLSLTIPGPGWTSHQGFLYHEGEADEATLGLYPTLGHPSIYTNVCAHTGLLEFEDTIDGQAQALAALPDVEVIAAPTATSVGGKPASSVSFTIPADIACANSQYWIWNAHACGDQIACTQYPSYLGGRESFWFIQLEARRFAIQLEDKVPNDDPAYARDVQALIDSIRFE